MKYNEKLAKQQMALKAATEVAEGEDKKLLACEKQYSKAKYRVVFKVVILLLLLAVAAATYMLATSDSAISYLTDKLVEATSGTEEELGFWLSTVKETLTDMPTVMEQFIIMAGAAVISILLATIGAGGTGFGWGLIASLIGMGGMAYFFKGIHFIGYLPVPVCILAVLVKLRDALRYSKKCRVEAENAATACKKAREASEAEKEALAKLESDQRKAVQLYNDAVSDNNNEELIRRAAELGSDDAIAYIEKLERQRTAEEGKRLYAKATESEITDEALMEKAAELGNPEANLYLGKKLCEEASTGIYTSSEKENILADAVDCLNIAIESDDTAISAEAEFWAISCQTMYESYNAAGWHAKLDRLRELKKTGLPSQCDEVYDTLVQTIVDVIDELDSKAPSTAATEPKLKRKYCAYNNSGVCTFYSTASYLAKCDYMQNPGDCSAALNQKALRFEFE